MKKQYILLIALIVFSALAILFSFGKGIEKRKAPAVQTPALVPTRFIPVWQKYENTQYLFSIDYFSTHYPEEVFLDVYKNKKPEFALEFRPLDKSKFNTDTIYLTIYNADGLDSVSEWLQIYATEETGKEARNFPPPKALFNVISQSEATVAGNEAKFIIQKSPEGGDTTGSAVILKGDYVYILSHNSGFVQDIFEKILSSVHFL